jgi:hypothetical protein
LHQPKRAKSPAQRAREYRARKKKASVGNPTPPAPTVTARRVTAMTPAVTSRPITDVTSPVTLPPVTPSRRPGRLPPPPGFTDLEKSTAELVAACQRGIEAARQPRVEQEIEAAERAIEEAQAVQTGLYHALIRAVDHLDGEVRLIALAAIAKAEGREEA